MRRYGTIELFDFQEDGLESVFHAFDNGIDRALLQLPTGTGKTILMGAIAHESIFSRRWPTLLLAHRTELLGQAGEKLARMGLDTVIEKAGSRAQAALGVFGARGTTETVVLGSIQTMKGGRLGTWPEERFGLIMVDEAHHIVSPQYRALLAHFKKYKLLGVTATADRADGQNLGKIFTQTTKPVYEFKLLDAIELGYLSPIEVRRIYTGISLNAVKKTTEGDLNLEDLATVISPEINRLSRIILDEVGATKSIGFAPNVRTAEAFASCISARGVRARAVSSKDTPEFRAQAIEDFAEGRLNQLWNYGVFTEGFDDETIMNVICARPTTSRPLYSQMVGRGTRRHPTKKKCVLIDLVMNSEIHDLVHPVELFDNSDFDYEVEQLARKTVDSGQILDLAEAVRAAERTHRENKRLRVIRQDQEAVKYRKVTYNPMGMCDVGLLTYRRSDFEGTWRATPKQIEELKKFNVESPECLTRTGAQRRLNILYDRRKRGLASHKQLAHLISNGVDEGQARNMTITEASKQLSMIFGR